MNNLSKNELILIIIPIISGVLFILMVFLNHALFDNHIIMARQAIGFEIIFFIIGFIATITQIPFFIRYLFRKQWKQAFLFLVSGVTFWASIMFGGSQGAAMFYAT